MKSSDGDITESLLESHDTLIKYYNYYHRNYYYQMLLSKLLAFKQGFKEEVNYFKNRVEVLKNMLNASSSHEKTAVLKDEMQFQPSVKIIMTFQNVIQAFSR